LRDIEECYLRDATGTVARALARQKATAFFQTSYFFFTFLIQLSATIIELLFTFLIQLSATIIELLFTFL